MTTKPNTRSFLLWFWLFFFYFSLFYYKGGIVLSEFNRYLKTNKEFFEEPIIKRFFANSSHVHLLKKAIESKDVEADKELNEKFTIFFLHYRLIKYVATLSKNYSVDFDKKVNTQKNRYLLNLDMPVNDTGATIIDLTETGDPSVLNQVIRKSRKLSEEISDEDLYQAFLNLTDKQKEILELAFIYGLSHKEIASYFGNSPQNISKLNKKALTNMHKDLKQGRKKNSEETNLSGQ